MRFAEMDSWQADAGLTDVDVALIAGCAHTTIGRYKRGEIRALDPDKRARICDASGGRLKPAHFAEFEDALLRAHRAEGATASSGAVAP